MVCQPVRIALLLGAITAVAVSPARAEDNAPASTKPGVRTIQVTECVPETYKVKRTCYRVECKTETYDTYRCESVPEVRERVVTCVKRVPVQTVQTRKVCKHVNVCEDRTVMKTCHKYVQETVMVKKLVRLGHWECKTECRPDFFGGLHQAFSKCCGDNCCGDACGSNCCRPTRTVTRKHWVHCPEYTCCPKTVCKKVCYQVPVTCKVNVCKTVWSEEKVNVCSYRCVEEKRTEKYTCCVTRKVPCKATRTVRVCVPYEQEVTCCRMVARTVTREVADCCNPCCDPCARHSLRDRFQHGHRHDSCCCR